LQFFIVYNFYLRGCNFNYLHWAPKNLATPLILMTVVTMMMNL